MQKYTDFARSLSDLNYKSLPGTFIDRVLDKFMGLWYPGKELGYPLIGYDEYSRIFRMDWHYPCCTSAIYLNVDTIQGVLAMHFAYKHETEEYDIDMFNPVLLAWVYDMLRRARSCS